MAKRSKFDILDRLSDVEDRMLDPKTGAKEMKTLKLRSQNLKDMLDEGMEEFKKGGKVTKKKRGGRVRGDGIAVKGKTKGTIR
jgi:hypothetical protein